MTPAPSAGSEGTKKKRRRKRPTHRSPQNSPTVEGGQQVSKSPAKKTPPARTYAKRVDEVGAGNYSGLRVKNKRPRARRTLINAQNVFFHAVNNDARLELPRVLHE